VDTGKASGQKMGRCASKIQDRNTYISSLTQGECSEESKTHLSAAIKADHTKIVIFIDKSAGCQRKSRNPLEGEMISIRGPEGLVLIIPGRMRNKITSTL